VTEIPRRGAIALFVLVLSLVGLWAAAQAGPHPARLTGQIEEPSPDEPAGPADAEAARLQGSWRLLSLECDGKEVDESMLLRDREPIRRSLWTFRGDRIFMTAGTETLEGRFRLDLLRNPRRIDVTFSDQGKFATPLFGIWTVEGNVLQMCFARSAHRVQRPAEFETKAGTGYFLVVLKREGAPDAAPRTAPEALPVSRVKPARDRPADTDKVYHLRERHFSIPFAFTEPARVELVNLFVSEDEGRSWRPVDSAAPNQKQFRYRAAKDGTYWFAVQSVSPEGTLCPARNEELTPGIKVCVDTCPPEVRLRRTDDGIAWEIRDENPDPSTLKLRFRPLEAGEDAPWAELPVEQKASGSFRWGPKNAPNEAVVISLSVRDRAGNETTSTVILPPVGLQ
jgi:uncharacterized protein (TIGR03067 family)